MYCEYIVAAQCIANKLYLQCEDKNKHLVRKYLPWLSRYMVTKRVSVEFELHLLYNSCLKWLNSIPFNDLVESETLRIIRVSLFPELPYLYNI